MERTNWAIWAAMAAILTCAASAKLASAPNSISGQNAAKRTIETWPAHTKNTASVLIEKYGPPPAAGPQALVWQNKGEWTRLAVYRDAVKDSLPLPHEDFLETTVNYNVPADKVADLIKFDHALVIDIIRGTLSSYGDGEKANMLALNLADEIVIGKRDVASAQGFMKRTLSASAAGKSSPYMEKLMFSNSLPGTLERNSQKNGP